MAFLAAILLAFVSISSAPLAHAHFNGNSWEFLDGSFVIDIGYDTDVFLAGNYTRFDFALKDEETLEPRPFAEVWVRIVKEGEGTVLATGVHAQPIGPTTLLYDFSREGSYMFEASYRDARGDNIATTSFPIVVTSPPGILPLSWPAVGAVGAAAVVCAYILYRLRKRA